MSARFDAVRNADAVALLEERGMDALPLFISVDPDRDTPEQLANFTDNIHEGMIGLTGSREQVDAAVQAYRAYYQIHDQTDEFYLVDHTAFTYLVLPEHRVCGLLPARNLGRGYGRPHGLFH